MAKREKKPAESNRTDGGAIGTRQEKILERNKALDTLNFVKDLEKDKKASGYIWMQNKFLRIKKLVNPNKVQLAVEQGYLPMK